MINKTNQKINDTSDPADAESTAASAMSQATDPQSVNKSGATLSEEQIIDKFGEVIDDPERLSEGLMVQQMMKAMPTLIEEGSEWFIMPKAWLDTWEKYCYIDVINAGAEQEPSDFSGVDRAKPPRVPFRELFQEKEGNQVIDQAMKTQWQNYQIKRGLREGVDYILVTKDVFDFIIKKYRS